MPDFSKPVFIVSAPRSGSTLFRLILDAHPRLAVPSPAWLYEMVYPYLYSYGDLARPENLTALAEDFFESPFIQNMKLDFTPQDLVSASREPTFRGLYDALHRHYAESTGKERWGEKSPRNSFWMEEIKQDFEDAQFVHIVRDGRDMAIDIAASPEMLPENVYSGAHVWKDFAGAAHASGKRLSESDYYVIRYEDLCADPENALKKLCGFLKEDFDGQMLSHHETDSSKNWSSLPNHVKSGRPISTEYCEMYKKRLPAGDVSALEEVMGELLVEFGYPVGESAKPIPAKLAAQLMESEMISATRVIAYRKWHAERRRERLGEGVWKLEDRKSLLRSLC